ncbi:MAG: Brp/Blh family beta-carotene 15,15'-dioxygenase [Bacteroidota bacterium]
MYLFQLIALLLIILIGRAFDISSESDLGVICLVVVALVGIPHGALDHKIHLLSNKNASFKRFMIKYLAIAAVYVLWWVLHSPSALWFFIILSAYHFGQETMESYELPSSLITRVLLGSALLVGSLSFHYDETYDFVSSIGDGYLMKFPLYQAQLFGISLGIIAVLYLLIRAFGKKSGANRMKYLKLISFLLLYAAVNSYYGLLVSFSVYFVLFHSLNAFRHQYEWLKMKYHKYNFALFLKDLSGFSLLAVVGIAIILVALDLDNTQQIITYFFILVSIITLPHAIEFDQFYKLRDASSKS